ncbi:MAG: hypothetical protein IH950_00875 [Bacteroidetes bacterium]|nr:hypothetical protein [Bacteroidota bacterium]
MKQFKLVAMSICSVLLLWMLFSVPAYSRASTIGSVEDDGQNYVGRIIVITDARTTPGVHCGDTFLDYRAVIINPAGGAALVTAVGIDPNQAVSPGDRFDIIS